MKKIISIVLAVSLLLLSACNVKVAETNDETKSQASASNAETADNAESQTSSVGADNEIIDYDGTLFGVIVKPIENFKVLPLPETVPYVYEENGLFGYKNPDGSVLIPAEYNVAQDFYMGFGSVRKDTTVNGEPNYEWFEVTSKGKIFDVDSYTYMEGIGLWVAVKDGKHGVINAEGEEIIPLEYDFHALAYDESFYTGFKDGSAFSFDLKKGCSYTYEPYNETKKDEYTSVIDLADYDLAVLGHSLTVNGEQDDYGEYMPLDILKYINWDVYSGKEKIYHGKASVMGGVYEGTLEFNFPLLSDDNTVLFAVPDYVDPFSTKIDLDNDHDKYKAVIEQYLKDRNIENSPYVMDKAYAGDILNNGSKSAVITVSSTAEFREERWSESWSEEEYKENKAAIFSAVLLIPDCEKPHEYIVVDEAVRQDGGHAPMCGSFYIIDVADVLKQNGCELLLVNFGYESRNYAIFSLTDSNKMN